MTTPKIPITVITGFVGSGKTTMILNLLPQLRAQNPSYKLALIKNEIGDLNVDSQLAAAAEMTGVSELLGACICCTNVGQIGDALKELDETYAPNRVIIETSGSAEPIKLMVELKRLSQETGRYALDGVVSVIDVENWDGYASTSYTAKLQAQQTDLIVLNKWENLSEMAFDKTLDKLGDMDVDTPHIKSDKGWISKDLLFGIDERMARDWVALSQQQHDHDHDHKHGDGHKHDHNEEMEALSITFTSASPSASLDTTKLATLLKSAPKDEVYRIKAVLRTTQTPANSDGTPADDHSDSTTPRRYILNWSFGRWMWTLDQTEAKEEPVLRMSIFTGRYESSKWLKRIEAKTYTALTDGSEGELIVKRVL
ncbi:cobW-domain-containing protein [Aureobasidium pullulans]|uniref:CobW-domain-containing protein n=1 Tax=Aureobasidium pullulans TaxID=5580 RepID=A0AB74JQW0_AURPU|nr:cobW-domain-containing protein [Aureobasidium pullulans]THX46067.1 cobW-domain-containing protein [Aureobasidium pullulans]